jgi:hypothetical protein
VGWGAFLWRWNSFQGYDDVFFIREIHSKKFAIAAEPNQLNLLQVSEPCAIQAQISF